MHSERISTDLQMLFSPFFPSIDLGRVRIYTHLPFYIHWFAAIKPVAITIGKRIYFKHKGKGGYDPHSVDGIELIAHELVHVEQYARYRNKAQFGLSYFKEYRRGRRNGSSTIEAYQDIRFEKEAVEKARRIIMYLRSEKIRL